MYSQSYRPIVVRALVFLFVIGSPIVMFFFMNEFRGVGYQGWVYLKRLNQPSFALTTDAYTPIWYTLYALFGLATYILWYTNGFVHSLGAFLVATAKLLFSLMWFPIFYYWEHIMGAFVITVILWIFNGITMIFYAGLFQLSGFLLIPDQVWLSYLTVWTYFLWAVTD